MVRLYKVYSPKSGMGELGCVTGIEGIYTKWCPVGCMLPVVVNML